MCIALLLVSPNTPPLDSPTLTISNLIYFQTIMTINSVSEFEDLRKKMKENDSGTTTPNRRHSRKSSKTLTFTTMHGLPDTDAARDFLEAKKEFERLVLEDESMSELHYSQSVLFG